MVDIIDVPEKKELRRIIKWSLKIQPRLKYHGQLGRKLTLKLDSLLAYAVLDKSKLSSRTQNIVHLHFTQGWDYQDIAIHHRVSVKTISREINTMLDKIIDNAPSEIIASLLPQHYEWLPGKCGNCGGDLFWDAEGAYGGDGEYCCLHCSRRFTSMLLPLVSSAITVTS